MNQDTCQKGGNNSKKGNNMNFTFYTKRCAFRKNITNQGCKRYVKSLNLCILINILLANSHMHR